MDKEDLLPLMEALTTEASDTDSDSAAATPVGTAHPVSIPSSPDDVKVGQKKVTQRKNNEMEETSFSFSQGRGAEAGDRSTGSAPEVSSDTGGNVGKKNSRKRRNRKKSKTICLPWPLTQHPRASSTTNFLCQASFMGASSIASVRMANKEQRKKGVNKRTTVLDQFWQTSASPLMSEGSPIQASSGEASVVSSKELKMQKKISHKRRAKKNQKLMAGPWPLTVQAWASCINPTLEQDSFTKSLQAVDYGAKSKNRSAKGDYSVPILSLSGGVEAGDLGSFESPIQGSPEEVASKTIAEEKMEKKRRHKKRQEKDGAPVHPWPMAMQAWASFSGTEDWVQKPSQEISLEQESWPPPQKRKDRTKFFIPWSQGIAEESPLLATASLHTSLKEVSFLEVRKSKMDKAVRNSDTKEEEQLQVSKLLPLESYQVWANEDRFPGDQDQNYWRYPVLDLAKQDEGVYYGNFFSHERKASTLTRCFAHTSASETEMGRKEEEEDKAKPQTVWMGKWGGF